MCLFGEGLFFYLFALCSALFVFRFGFCFLLHFTLYCLIMFHFILLHLILCYRFYFILYYLLSSFMLFSFALVFI